MKQSEKGFTIIELAVAVAIVALIGSAAASTTYQVLNTAERSNEHMTAVQQVQNAGYWLSHDAYMADNVIADNLTLPTFLVLKWTEWGYGEDNVYYVATYSIENISGGVGQLKRRLQDSIGTDQHTLVADYIYYNPADSTNTTSVTYQSPTINLRVAARFGSASEVRDYEIYRRPNF